MALGNTAIYKIQSISNPKRIYIGSTINITERWRLHIFKLMANKHENSKLQRHVNKYGIDDLQFSIVIICHKLDLLIYEQCLIDQYDPYFNICKIATNRLGVKASIGTKLKQSISAKNRPPISDITRKKISCLHKGNTYRVGKKNSKEHIDKSRRGQQIVVINIETGELIESMKIAAVISNMCYRTFCNQLTGISKNKTKFKIYELTTN